MSNAQWAAVKEEGEEITRGIGALMDRPPDDTEVQGLVARHHAWIERFYPAPAERYRGLGALYAEHDKVRAYYDPYRPGLADYVRAALACCADQTLDEGQ